MKKHRISIVIPVYNEAHRIADCLSAIARQTVKPLEVIVVDNNSTDQTAAIARRFPFVTVLHEPRQGVVYARDRGFNAVRGDIIGRIDADTIIDPNWVATVAEAFTDPARDLITGAMAVREIGAPTIASAVDLFWRRYLARKLGNRVGLQGANMALRTSVWKAVRNDLCHKKGLHEDFDLGIHANNAGYNSALVETMRASICHRQLDASLKDFMNYALTSPRTYEQHNVFGAKYMYRVIAFVFFMYPLITTLAHGYDPELDRFSLSHLFTYRVARVNPAAYVD